MSDPLPTIVGCVALVSMVLLVAVILNAKKASSGVRQELEKARARVKSLQGENSQLRGEVSRLQGWNDSLRSENSVSGAKIKVLNDAFAAAFENESSHDAYSGACE